MAGLERKLSIHNFRPVLIKESSENDNTSPSLYRSSRPDLLLESEVDTFNSYGIQCIIDMRSKSDFARQSGDKLLQKQGHFESYSVLLPKGRTYNPGEEVNFKAVNKDNKSSPLSAEKRPLGRHYHINFFTFSYIFTIIKRAPWYIRILSFFVMIYDLLMRNGNYYFIRLYAKFVINKGGLLAAYLDMLEMSKNSIAAALKLMCKEENIPVLINCAHGKDRTGIVAAMVQTILGETRDDIIKDYALSEKMLEPIKMRLHEEIVAKYNWDSSFTHAHPETMAKALEYVDDNYGSVLNYLESIGFSQEEQNKLRNNLLKRR